MPHAVEARDPSQREPAGVDARSQDHQQEQPAPAADEPPAYLRCLHARPNLGQQVGLAQVLEYVVDWGGPDFVNEVGAPIPYSEAAVGNLRSKPFQLIFDAVQKHIEAMESESAEKN